MNKLKMHSSNITQDNIARIRDLFPGCVTEAKGEDGIVKLAVDFDQLRQELAESIVEGPQERYHLNWPGKREALLTANAPIAKTLRPCREGSVDFDTTKNLFIEGDNLDALKLLQETYLGKVKMIYIDPPYNTGNDFIYEDDFAEDSETFLQRSNQKDGAGKRLVANTESNGRFHSDWMSMIYARLKLARSLLKDDGLIFVSIDDGEYQNLRKICDEIFGEDNFIENIIWKKRYGGGAKEKFLVSLHEYTLVFAKNVEALDNIYVPLTEESIKRYYTQRDSNFSRRGPYRTHPLEATKSMGERKNLVFPITGSDGVPILPQRQWLWSKERVAEALEKGELEFIKSRNGKLTVHTKQYLRDDDGAIRQGKPFSIIDDIYTQHGTNEIIELFGNAQIFSFPKPSAFIQKLVDMGTKGRGNEIILDFFAGSASTAQAVIQANAKDGGDRQLILVQLPEQCDEQSEAFNAGYKTIAEISKERIRRAGKKFAADLVSASVDTGFRVLKIDTSNMADVYYAPDALDKAKFDLFVDNIKPDRTPEDLLFQVMLDWGVDLALPITKQSIQGMDVFFVDGNTLAACFDASGSIDEAFVKELAKHQPLRVVFRDAGYKSSAVKINVEQIFKLLSSATEVKCI
tara:strand:- start:1381 stop:3276 length:1896 start_codon:yes stop_codon:yes gene_type:complete